MSKVTFLLIFASLFSISLFAQQKVTDDRNQGGVLPNRDAILELESANKGLLHVRLPLVRTTDPAPLTNHVAGMMVYNTATVNDVVPAIYYNDGEKWVRVLGDGEGAGSEPGDVYIDYNPVTYQITYLDEDGNTQVIDLVNAVKANETLTSLTYDTNNSILTYVDENGDSHQISLSSRNIRFNNSGSNIVARNVEGALKELANRIGSGGGGPETVTTLIDNGDGTFTYTSENGTVTIFDTSGGSGLSVQETAPGVFTFTDAAGVTTVIDTNTGGPVDAGDVSFDNTGTSLTSVNVEDALK